MLTDEDRAAAVERIAEIYEPNERGLRTALSHMYRDAYAAGKSAGAREQAERDAKICDSYAIQIADKYYATGSGKQCAAAIRALVD